MAFRSTDQSQYFNQQILYYAKTGLPNSIIAKRLGISEMAVQKRKTKLRQRGRLEPVVASHRCRDCGALITTVECLRCELLAIMAEGPTSV